MHDLKINEIKQLLKNLPKEKQVFTLFKILRDCPDRELECKIYNELSKKIKDISKLNYILGVINSFKHYSLIKNKELKEKIFINYKKILENTKKLALEFKINNSLELCNLYTYLLWNGYFSKDKKMTYQLDNRMNIDCFYFCDIMNGFSVCLNFSDMLTDFINEFDYSAATLVNNLDENCEISSKVKLVRNNSEMALNTNLINSISKSNMNHTFNLINENGNLYIYDPTNLSLLKLISTKKASLMSGKGEAILKPYFSYVLNIKDKAINTLDLFHESTEFNCPYSINDYASAWQFCIELLENNKNLLDDFHDEIKTNIINVSEAAEVVQKTKKY